MCVLTVFSHLICSCTLLPKHNTMWIYSCLPFSVSLLLGVLKLQDAVLCRCATETMREIYWPRVLPFDTRDVANTSCAISHLFRLPCKADLSCLRAIFKPWTPETYGAMGYFIINALHLSDLIQAWCILCESMLYIYLALLQTRAVVTSLSIHTLVRVTPVTDSFELLWGAAMRLDVLFTVHLTCDKV